MDSRVGVLVPGLWSDGLSSGWRDLIGLSCGWTDLIGLGFGWTDLIGLGCGWTGRGALESGCLPGNTGSAQHAAVITGNKILV